MSKFEQIGIEHQLSSANKFSAMKRFKNSCMVCCYKGIHLECDKCGIASVHKEVIACFDDLKKFKKKGKCF